MHPHVSDTPIPSLTQTQPARATSGENVSGGRKRSSLKAALSQAYSKVSNAYSIGKTRQVNAAPHKAVFKKTASLDTTGSTADNTLLGQSQSDDDMSSVMTMHRQSAKNSVASRDRKSRSVIVNEDLYEWWGPTDAVIIEGETLIRDNESGQQDPDGHNTMKVVALLATTI